MPRGSKKGERRGGRKAGTPNKVTTAVRQAIQDAFDGLGGVPALVEWAKKNKTLFYTKVMPRIVPLSVTSGTDGPLALELILTDGPATSSDAESGLS